MVMPITVTDAAVGQQPAPSKHFACAARTPHPDAAISAGVSPPVPFPPAFLSHLPEATVSHAWQLAEKRAMVTASVVISLFVLRASVCVEEGGCGHLHQNIVWARQKARMGADQT